MQPECHYCEEPITGIPLRDPEDRMHRAFCDEDCLTSAAEAAGGAMRHIVYDAEFD